MKNKCNNEMVLDLLFITLLSLQVIRDGRQISFDVIANVRKVLDPADHDR